MLFGAPYPSRQTTPQSHGPYWSPLSCKVVFFVWHRALIVLASILHC